VPLVPCLDTEACCILVCSMCHADAIRLLRGPSRGDPLVCSLTTAAVAACRSMLLAGACCLHRIRIAAA